MYKLSCDTPAVGVIVAEDVTFPDDEAAGADSAGGGADFLAVTGGLTTVALEMV